MKGSLMLLSVAGIVALGTGVYFTQENTQQSEQVKSKVSSSTQKEKSSKTEVSHAKKSDAVIVSDMLPTQESASNQPVMWSFLEGLINYKTDYNFGAEGGIIYVTSPKLSAAYQSAYIAPASNQNYPLLPSVGTEPQKSHDAKNMQVIMDQTIEQFPHAVVTEDDYQFLLVDNQDDSLVNYLTTVGLDVDTDYWIPNQPSKFTEEYIDAGKGWPTEILRKPENAENMLAAGIDMSTDFWDEYNFGQFGVYASKDGSEHRITADDSYHFTDYGDGSEFGGTFINTMKSTAEEKIHDFIENRTFKYGTPFN